MLPSRYMASPNAFWIYKQAHVLETGQRMSPRPLAHAILIFLLLYKLTITLVNHPLILPLWTLWWKWGYLLGLLQRKTCPPAAGLSQWAAFRCPWTLLFQHSNYLHSTSYTYVLLPGFCCFGILLSPLLSVSPVHNGTSYFSPVSWQQHPWTSEWRKYLVYTNISLVYHQSLPCTVIWWVFQSCIRYLVRHAHFSELFLCLEWPVRSPSFPEEDLCGRS